jgi:ribosome-binding factor A
MSNRLLRINELIQRELSAYLRKRWATEAATITISSCDITPDLKVCKVFVSVFGVAEQQQARFKWLQNHAVELRKEVGRHVVLKWTPELVFMMDAGPAHAARVLSILDEIERKDRDRNPQP